MKKQNEETACEAFLQILCIITGVQYTKMGSPDEKVTHRRDVDYLLAPYRSAGAIVAVEHTRLESFEGQLTYVNRSYDIVEEINSKCKGKLPSDRYYILVVPPELVEALHKTNKKRFIDDYWPWVVDKVDSIRQDDNVSRTYGAHTVTLICGGSHPDINGSVGRIPGQPEQIDDLQEKRLWLAIWHGLSKFPRYKLEGYKTALLLEDVAGTFYSSALIRNRKSVLKRVFVRALVDYIVVFVSIRDRMIVGNVWKEGGLWYPQIPYSRRFSQKGGVWKALA
jgi:hypothetical protein